MSLWNYREAYELKEQQADAARESARERELRERQLREQRQRELQKRTDDRLREMQMKRAEREAAAEQREAERGERILARLEAARAGRPYTPPGSSCGDPVASWKAAVAEALAVCGGDRQRAVCMANRRNPGLRVRVIAAANSAR